MISAKFHRENGTYRGGIYREAGLFGLAWFLVTEVLSCLVDGDKVTISFEEPEDETEPIAYA